MKVTKVLSIEITDLVTHICEIDYKKKKPVIRKSAIFENPKYSVEDGFVLDRPPYKNALKEALNTARIKTRDVVFSLSSTKIISREVTIPDIKPELIPGLIENERNEYFPMDTTGHEFAFEIIEKIKETKQQRIQIYAAPDILIKNMMVLAGELELNVVAIDYSGNAIYQFLKREQDESIEMYLQINEKGSQFTILDDGMLELQRNMNFGVITLVNAINDSRYYNQELDLNEVLLKLKEEQMLYSDFSEADSVVPENAEEKKYFALKSRLTDVTRPMIGNLSSVLEYYNTKKRGAIIRAGVPENKKKKKVEDSDSLAPGSGSEGGTESNTAENSAAANTSEPESSPTARIYIGGVGANIRGIKELIESEFNGIEVVLLPALPGIRVGKDNRIAEEHSTELIACIGASYATISFLKEDEKEALSKTLIASLIGLIAVIIAAVVIILNGKSEYDKIMEDQEYLKAQQDALEAKYIEELEEERNAAVNKYASVKNTDEGTFNYNISWNDILSYLEADSVSNILVSSITSTSTDLSMNITVPSKKEAAKLIQQFKKIPYFSQVLVNSISESIDEETGIKVVGFSVKCTYQELPEEETSEGGKED
ncbi:MAG: pilus assembly protein PilM [Lachnospiraceae bacterium]|nr:pilus assembly protein PilM [Lachnospiraceae bacterium]